MTGPILVLDGSAIHDIAGFYAEINRVFMACEDWQLAPSLDALDDLLYGGYGALAGHWKDIAAPSAKPPCWPQQAA
jgi:RNAse (barnase) inhibitor barstar